MITSARTRSSEVAVRAVLCVAAGLLLAIASDGPDFGHYMDWAAAALDGNIFTLPGNVLSPRGVPFSLASSGPGMLFAATQFFLVNLVSAVTAAYVAGWLAAIVYWVSTLAVLRRMAGERRTLVLVGAGALFVGTHAGFYSFTYATEVFADALVAAAWAFGLSRDRWRLVDTAAAGALAGLLLVVRPYLLLYDMPILWLALCGSRAGSSPRSAAMVDAQRSVGVNTATTPLRDWAARGIALGVPLVVAATQYAVVNRWMTGSLLRPPYVYSGAGFTSVDIWHPQFAAVLAHPWHGLLAYHPLYAIAFGAVLLEAIRSPSFRWLWGATAVAFMAHLWVQAAWYVWWLGGGGTLGLRGMAPAALPLVAGLIATIRYEMDAGRRRDRFWLRAMLLACAWSFPLLLHGPTQFHTWAPLLASQIWVAPLIAGLLGVWIWQARVRGRAAAIGDEAESRLDAAILIALSVGYLAGYLAVLPTPGARLVRAVIAAGVVACGGWAARRVPRTGVPRRAAPVLLTLIVFSAQVLLFARLAVRTERHVASGAPPPREFRYVAASPVDELRVTYAEYHEVPGFETEKAAYRRFLIWQRIDASRMRPADRAIAEQVARVFAADPKLGALLIEPTVEGGVVHLVSTEMGDSALARAHVLAATVPGVVGVDDATP